VAELAQVNVAMPRAPLDAPLLADFVAALDPVNARADRAPGFRWRLQDEGGNATSIAVSLDPRMIVNMSVWADLEALRGWVYADRGHLAVMRRRREWFEKLEMFVALWWVPDGHRPTVAEAEQRLEHLRANGPTPWAFTFRQPFAPGGLELPLQPGELCPA
jgi:Domain of unknown function (DUF3291)